MLVRPFIQTIPAFDVSTSNGVATVCVLGGDIVENVNYEIYSGSSLLYSSAFSVTDNGGDSVRNFYISLSSAQGLQNNYSYTIRVYTSRTDNGTTTTSGYSSVQYFSCYTTPLISIKDSLDTAITSGYEFTSQSGELFVSFDKVDSDSGATLNDISVEIYGTNSDGKDLVYSSGMVYSPFTMTFDNLLPTTGTTPIYSSYSLRWVAHTVQNMELSGAYSNMSCNYTITQIGNLIQAQNNPETGGIRVNFISSVSGTKTSPFSDTYSIRSMAVDGENVYCGGTSGKFAIFDVAEDSFGTLYTQGEMTINDCVCDEDKVYICCGDEGVQDNALYVYTKATGTFGNKITIFDSSLYAVPSALAIDNTNIYVGAYSQFPSSQPNSSFAKFQKSDMTKTIIANPFAGVDILCMVSDGSNVYCAGGNGSFAIYNKSTGTFGSLITSPFSSSIVAIDCDDDYVYCGAINGSFAIYNKSTGTFGSLIPNPFSLNSKIIASVSVDSMNVYVGGGNGYFAVYNKASGSFGELIETPFGSNKDISVVKNDNNSVYLGGDNGLFYLLEKEHEVAVRRKNVTENGEFITLVLLESQQAVKEYSFVDYYTKTNCVYEYQVRVGNTIDSVQVLSQFCGAYIADGSHSYSIVDEWEKSNAQQIQKSVLYEPYGRKYPVVAYNAITNYRSGSDTAMLRANSISNQDSDYIDRFAQTKLTREFNSFLTNRKAKVIKDFNGDIAIVNIIEAVPNTYQKELGNTLATTQFDWVEVGNFTEEDFTKLGIRNSFHISDVSNNTESLIPVVVEKYDVNISVNNSNYGTITRSSVLDIPAGTYIVISNNTMTINGTTVVANPKPNTATYAYSFVGWSVSNGTQVNSDLSIIANFGATYIGGGAVDV